MIRIPLIATLIGLLAIIFTACGTGDQGIVIPLNDLTMSDVNKADDIGNSAQDEGQPTGVLNPIEDAGSKDKGTVVIDKGLAPEDIPPPLIDEDGDGIGNDDDNCWESPNPDQEDLDKDGEGDACDPDKDGDSILNDDDNCWENPNPDQGDLDNNGEGDACDDYDDDGVSDEDDNCWKNPNPNQEDLDNDGEGNVCDPDKDGDSIPDDDDNCWINPNPDQEDLDDDGEGDACDPDKDGDSILNDDDNCWEIHNPDQEDLDDDGEGDPCDPDQDGDLIPDEVDGWPTDGIMPGTGLLDTVYAHTANQLFSFNISSEQLWMIGNFTSTTFSTSSSVSSVTDIALDRYGVMYAITFTKMYTCQPANAQCTFLGNLPQSFNGLTLIPMSNISEALGCLPNQGVAWGGMSWQCISGESTYEDIIVGIANSGAWYWLNVEGQTLSSHYMGSYGSEYTSSGDVFSIENVGTYAAVSSLGTSADLLVKVNPANGSIIEEINTFELTNQSTVSNFSSIYGMAGWFGDALAFNSGGEILRMNLNTGAVELIVDTAHSWWGAGVRTRL